MKKEKVKKLSADVLAMFCSQTAMLLNGGIPLFEGIDMLYDEIDDGNVRKVLKSVSEKVKEGCSLGNALEESGAFPTYMVQMIEVGEQTGKLEDILNSLSKYYEREFSVEIATKSTVTYPLTLFGMMIVILLVLVLKIMPIFSGVFEELDRKTDSARRMMDFGMMGARIATGVALFVPLIMIMSLLLSRVKAGRAFTNKLIKLFPFMKNIAYSLGNGKVMATMSAMVASGMDIQESLERSKKVVGDSETLNRVNQCLEFIKAGENTAVAMCTSEILTPMQARMLAVGIKAGSVDNVVTKISASIDEEISGKLATSSSRLETILVVLLSVMVGVILVSIMMPLISVIASL